METLHTSEEEKTAPKSVPLIIQQSKGSSDTLRDLLVFLIFQYRILRKKVTSGLFCLGFFVTERTKIVKPISEIALKGHFCVKNRHTISAPIIFLVLLRYRRQSLCTAGSQVPVIKWNCQPDEKIRKLYLQVS